MLIMMFGGPCMENVTKVVTTVFVKTCLLVYCLLRKLSSIKPSQRIYRRCFPVCDWVYKSLNKFHILLGYFLVIVMI